MHNQLNTAGGYDVISAMHQAAREGAKPPAPALPCPIHSNAPTGSIARVPLLPRYALACWFSILHLIESTKGPCHLWTFTTEEVVPDEWFGNMHRVLIKYMGHAARQFSTGGKIPPNWGGVRVFELFREKEGGTLHAHWVMRGFMDWYAVNDCASRAGFGRVHVDPDPVTRRTAHYLASYLGKQGKLRGIRQWANIGTYDGVRGRDVSFDSIRNRKLKLHMAYHKVMGKGNYAAYLHALQDLQQDEGGEVPF